MDKALRGYLTELVGSFFLVFVCGAMVCSLQTPLVRGDLAVGLVGLAVAHGAVVAVLLSLTPRISQGCLNPAITLVLWVTKRLTGWQTIGMLAVQFGGAIAGGGLVAALFNPQVLTDSLAGTPHLRAFREALGDPLLRVGTSDLLLGMLVEAVLTALFTLAVMGTILESGGPKAWGGLIAGLAVTVCVLVGYGLTGAALNPARWLGTAVWQSTIAPLNALPVFADHPVYWIGPIAGALLAGVAYATLWSPPARSH